MSEWSGELDQFSAGVVLVWDGHSLFVTTELQECAKMKSIALFNIESYSSSTAILRLIEEYHDNIVLVATTDRYRGKNGGFLRQLITNYRRSGPDFLNYLSINFVVYFAALNASRLLAVFGRPSRVLSIHAMCQKFGIRYIKTPDINAADFLGVLKSVAPDVIVVYYFDQILKQPLIDVAKSGVINVHAAYLPNSRGVFPEIHTALRHGGDFGITVHEIVDTSIDAGPILTQTPVVALNRRSLLSMSKVIHDEGVALLLNVLNNFDQYYRSRTVQAPGTYYSFPTSSDLRELRKKGFRLYSIREFFADMF